jgi:FlaA1/EpsC-like NDP-sugar epimerase
MVNVSTDKAADPTSVLGQTKRVAEMAAMQAGGGTTLVASVRFGNVFGSRGSLPETFAHQIKAGVPVTITDPGMRRYFMTTIPQAASLVIEAAVLADGRSTFVLDMGTDYTVELLVRRYAEVVNPHDPLQIVYTGARPGEKIAEVLANTREVSRSTTHPVITAVRVAGTVPPDDIAALVAAVEDGEPADALRKRLADLTTTTVKAA